MPGLAFFQKLKLRSSHAPDSPRTNENLDFDGKLNKSSKPIRPSKSNNVLSDTTNGFLLPIRIDSKEQLVKAIAVDLKNSVDKNIDSELIKQVATHGTKDLNKGQADKLCKIENFSEMTVYLREMAARNTFEQTLEATSSRGSGPQPR